MAGSEVVARVLGHDCAVGALVDVWEINFLPLKDLTKPENIKALLTNADRLVGRISAGLEEAGGAHALVPGVLKIRELIEDRCDRAYGIDADGELVARVVAPLALVVVDAVDARGLDVALRRASFTLIDFSLLADKHTIL